jgi:ABC-2 type transport system ATP-binding protein
MFEMKDAFGDLIQSYSHGMHQKIVLIGALVHDPEVMIMDEPMVGLDPRSSHLLKEVMRERCDAGKTVFFSTHVLEVAEKICDTIGIINKGRLISHGTMSELREQAGKSESLENIFLELTE